MTVFTHPEFDNHQHLSFYCDPETGLRAIIDVYYERQGPDPHAVRRHVEAIGNTLDEIFARSVNEGLPTGVIANQMAEERFKHITR